MAQIIAHRGYHKHDETLTENTIPAFQAAVDLGAKFLELDTHRTSDDEWVVFHDRKFLDGSTFDKLTRATIEEIANEMDHRVDFLGDVFTNINAHINVEAKFKTKDLGASLTNFLVELDVLDRAHVSSFSRDALRGCRQVSDEVELSYLDLGFLTKSWKLLHDEIGLYSINPFFSFTRKRLVTQAHKLGLEVHVWTINKEKVMKRMIKRGVDGIITDALPIGLSIK